MSFFNRAFAKSFLAVVLVALSLVAFSGVSSAYTSIPPSGASTHVSQHLTTLSHCPGTLHLYHMNLREKACTGSTRPNTIYCSVIYYQNGPIGSAAWARGWGDCVNETNSHTYLVPRFLNDQASSWASCLGSGTFFVNQPYTNPQANYPGLTGANFPWGAVPNDSLSSILINDLIDQCNLPLTAHTYINGH